MTRARTVPAARLVAALAASLRERAVCGPDAVAVAVGRALRAVVHASRAASVEELHAEIMAAGSLLSQAQRGEPAIMATTMRVLHLLHEEAHILASAGTGAGLKAGQPSAQQDGSVSGAAAALRSSRSGAAAAGAAASDAEEEDDDDDDAEDSDAAGDDFSGEEADGEESLQALVAQAIQELIDELDGIDGIIAKDAREHISSGEVIMTLGYSQTTEVFLKAAAKARSFTVIVAETAPSNAGHTLARALASHPSISVLLVPDAAVYALMPRVSKLVLAPHCVLPNGALLATAGSALLASAARAHHTPVVALAGLHRISPDWALVAASSQGAAGLAAAAEGDPALVLPREHSKLSEEANVVSATWDYVEACEGLITNVGEHAPSFVHRLIKENYYVGP